MVAGRCPDARAAQVSSTGAGTRRGRGRGEGLGGGAVLACAGRGQGRDGGHDDGILLEWVCQACVRRFDSKSHQGCRAREGIQQLRGGREVLAAAPAAADAAAGSGCEPWDAVLRVPLEMLEIGRAWCQYSACCIVGGLEDWLYEPSRLKIEDVNWCD
jgi:hypothetical protein